MTLHFTLVADKATLRTFSDLRLHARFENRGKKPLSAVIDVTPLSHGSYTVEVQDADGGPPDLDSFGLCGTMSPLMEHEIFLVEPGAAVDVPVHLDHAGLAPGSYRLRVTYHARKSSDDEEGSTPVVKERLRHFWTGTLVSEWIPFTIEPA